MGEKGFVITGTFKTWVTATSKEDAWKEFNEMGGDEFFRNTIFSEEDCIDYSEK